MVDTPIPVKKSASPNWWMKGRNAGTEGSPSEAYVVDSDLAVLITNILDKLTITPVTDSIVVVAENTYTDPISVKPNFNAVLTVQDIADGSAVTVQQSYNNGSWEDREYIIMDCAGYSIPVLESNLRLRAGIKTGDFGSGSTTIRLSQG